MHLKLNFKQTKQSKQAKEIFLKRVGLAANTIQFQIPRNIAFNESRFSRKSVLTKVFLFVCSNK